METKQNAENFTCLYCSVKEGIALTKVYEHLKNEDSATCFSCGKVFYINSMDQRNIETMLTGVTPDNKNEESEHQPKGR